MPCLPINHDKLDSLSTTYDPTKPIYMLNLWKYRPTAVYLPEDSALAGAPCSGREASLRYRAAIGSVLPPNATVFFMSVAIAEVVAPKSETWDDVMIIRYESLEGFRTMVASEEYKKSVQPHRLAALDDFRLIMLDKLEM